MTPVSYIDGGVSRRVLLAPVTGADEAALDRTAGADAALGLLARVARDADGRPLRVETLTVSDADRMLAAVYSDLYGDQVDCRVTCRACGHPYQFALSLTELTGAQDAERPAPEPDGAWTLPDDRRVRAPTVADMASTPEPKALLAQLLLEGAPEDDEGGLEAFLERAAPLLSIDLETPCPHCGNPETARFDLAHYLATRLAGERGFLVRETHLIAKTYGWSLSEILALTREDRRAYASLIEAERAAALRPGRRLA